MGSCPWHKKICALVKPEGLGFVYIIGLGKTITQANAAAVSSGGNIISKIIFFTFIISCSLNFNLDLVG